MLGMLLALTGSGSQSHGSRGPHRVISGQWSLISEVTGDEITPERQRAIMQQFSLTSVTSLTFVTHHTRAHITSFVTMSRSITRNRLKGNCQPHARDPHHWRWLHYYKQLVRTQWRIVSSKDGGHYTSPSLPLHTSCHCHTLLIRNLGKIPLSVRDGPEDCTVGCGGCRHQGWRC